MNQFRNEMEIELAGVKILLRPTFSNIASMESDVGSVSYLVWKFSRGVQNQNKPTGANPKEMEEAVKYMPSMSEAAKIIFHNQAEKKYSIDEIWELVLKSGQISQIIVKCCIFIGKMLSSGNFDEAKLSEEPVAEEEKKS